MLERLRAAAGLSEWRAPEGTACWRATAAADQERGPPMGPTHQEEATLASYRDAVTERISAGEAFGDIEDAIDGLADLTSDQKAALWLFALTLHERGKQQRDAGARLLAVY